MTVPRVGELAGNFAEQANKQLPQLRVGPLTPVTFQVDPELDKALRGVVERVTGQATHCPDGESYGCASGVVAVMKTLLGGRWPDATLHSRQELRLHHPVRPGATVHATGRLEDLDEKAHHVKVVLSCDGRSEGRTLATHQMTLYWPQDGHAP